MRLIATVVSMLLSMTLFTTNVSAQGSYGCIPVIRQGSTNLADCLPVEAENTNRYTCTSGNGVPPDNPCDDFNGGQPFDLTGVNADICRDQSFTCQPTNASETPPSNQRCKLTSTLQCITCTEGDPDCTFQTCAQCEQYKIDNPGGAVQYVCNGQGSCTVTTPDQYPWLPHFADITSCQVHCADAGENPTFSTCNTTTGNPEPNGDGINTAIGCIPYGPTGLAKFALGWALGIGGGIALLMISGAAIIIMTSAGDPKKMQSGKELMTAAISGLLLIIFSTFILRFLGVALFNIF